MGRFATGVTIITAEADGGVRGMTANAFMSGSLTPPLCIISVSRKARLHGTLSGIGGVFGVSMLAQGQEVISRHFAGQGPTEPDLLFEHMQGVPVLANVCAALAAEIEARHDCGDHTSVRRPRARAARRRTAAAGLPWRQIRERCITRQATARRRRSSISGNWTTTFRN